MVLKRSKVHLILQPPFTEIKRLTDAELWTVVIVATVGSSQSEREKVNRGIGNRGHVT